MRLKSLHVRNYRIHVDTRVEFDASHNLVGGPNESGKSTLLEAAHRALFLNHRRGGIDLEAMQSKLTSGIPEVELTFEQGGTQYRLLKRFNGPRGHVELEDETHDQWTGAEAEQKLAQLLGLAEPLAPAQATKSWAHFWIRQGASSNDPTDDLNAEQATLLNRLQETGGAALMQSDLDATVALECCERYAEAFSNSGKVRAGSELNQAETALKEKQQRLTECGNTAARLESAIDSHGRATRQLEEIARTLPGLEQQEKQNAAKLEEAIRLKNEKIQLVREIEETANVLDSRKKADSRIRELAETAARLAEAIAPRTAAVKQAREAREAGESEITKLTAAVEAAATTTRRARHAKELLQHHVAHLQNETAFNAASSRLKKIDGLQQDLEPLKESLATLPKLTAKDLERLGELKGKADNARVSLEAIAAGVEWLGGDTTPTLDGAPLESGVIRTISEPCDLEVAGNRLRIRPGGGTSLEEVRQALQESEATLRDALEVLGVPDLATASAQLEKRNARAQQIREIEVKLDALEPTGTREEATRLRESLANTIAEIERLKPLAGEMPLPEELTAATGRLATASGDFAKVEDEETTARGSLKAAQNKAKDLIQNLERATSELNEATNAANQARIQHDVLVEEHGEQDTRREKISTLERALEDLRKREASLTGRLNELQPDLLEADLNRLRRAIGNQQQQRDQAKLEQATAGATLKSDGVSDPYAALEEARQAVERATDTHASAARRAGAIRLLHELFEDEHQQLSDQLTEPLAERISEYLQCLFGPQSKARVRQNTGEFFGLELVRPGGPFQFDDLSGGTKEQLAAAVRLAMAELLAEEHGGCLPVVFDDAFTNSDAERIGGLQRMLDFAAGRGLQVIVLTCAPVDYASLGARSIALEPPRPSQTVSESSPIPAFKRPASTSSLDTYYPAAVSQDDIDAFFATLRGLGGKSGNIKLREDLGWDEGRYNATKDFLVERGELLPGRGRGGSVSME